jgi:hypothetical protein
MKTYVSEQVGLDFWGVQALLVEAANSPTTPQHVLKNVGYGLYKRSDAVVVWDKTHVWVLNPTQWECWGKGPTHVGSRYHGYYLKKWDFKFNPSDAWKAVVMSPRLRYDYWFENHGILARRRKAEAARVARNASKRAAYAAKKAATPA